MRKAIKNTILTNIWSIVIVTDLLLRTSAISRVSFDFLICTNYVSGDIADKIALLKKNDIVCSGVDDQLLGMTVIFCDL